MAAHHSSWWMPAESGPTGLRIRRLIAALVTLAMWEGPHGATLAIIRRPDDFSDPLSHFQVQGAEQAANGRKHAQNAVRRALQPDRYDECAR